jgi:hypothetical protein
MKPLSEVAPGILVIQIQIQAEWSKHCCEECILNIMFLEWCNTSKTLSNLWQCFSCLQYERIALWNPGPGSSYTPAVWRELTTFWGTLQIRIQFVRQRENWGKPRYPLLPLTQTNNSIVKSYLFTLRSSRIEIKDSNGLY